MEEQNVTVTSAPDKELVYQPGMNITYTVFECLVAFAAVVGNALVMLVFHRERRLRRRTNYYIVSLAAADFLVGLLGIPFAILASLGLPRNLYACLFTVSLLVVLCTISIFCLVAVSIDRYWAILHPMGYSRNVRTKTAIVIIGVCWVAGTLVGFLPLLGWHNKMDESGCMFTAVMRPDYLVFLYFTTIVAPALLLAASYVHIYRVVLKQLRRIVTMNPGRRGGGGGGVVGGGSGGGTMLRMLGPVKKSEVKATQNLSIIVLFFIICWFPLYTINCVEAFCSDCKAGQTATEFCIVLSHLNSAGNPLLYAYHLRDFRAALKSFLWGLLGVKDEGGGPGAEQGGCGGLTNAGYRSQGSIAVNNCSTRGSAWAPPAVLLRQATAGSLRGRLPGGGADPGAVTPPLHTLLSPPRALGAAGSGSTAHSSMTSIASSMGSVHAAAAAPAIHAFAASAATENAADDLPPDSKVEVIRQMSTVAEASQSEEDPQSSPPVRDAADVPDAANVPDAPDASDDAPDGVPDDAPRSLEALDVSALKGSTLSPASFAASALNASALNASALNASTLNASALNASTLNTVAAVGRVNSAFVVDRRNAFTDDDDDDDVFVPASAPNVVVVHAATAKRPYGASSSVTETEVRVDLDPQALRRGRSLHRPDTTALTLAELDNCANAIGDERTELSPRDGKPAVVVVTNGNGDLRRRRIDVGDYRCGSIDSDADEGDSCRRHIQRDSGRTDIDVSPSDEFCHGLFIHSDLHHRGDHHRGDLRLGDLRHHGHLKHRSDHHHGDQHDRHRGDLRLGDPHGDTDTSPTRPSSGRRLSPLKAVSDFFLGHKHSREEGSVGDAPSKGASRHHNGSVPTCVTSKGTDGT